MEEAPFDIRRVERPVPKLWTYYVLQSLIAGPGLVVVLPILYFRYHTLRYRFDDEGISMSWGILFRREVHLTYARIQDIHLVSNVVERWLGLARIHIQTASGKAEAQMTLEGILEYEAVRDHLYARLRGASRPAPPVAVEPSGLSGMTDDLRSVSRELRLLREALAASRRGDDRPEGGEGGHLG